MGSLDGAIVWTSPIPADPHGSHRINTIWFVSYCLDSAAWKSTLTHVYMDLAEQLVLKQVQLNPLEGHFQVILFTNYPYTWHSSLIRMPRWVCFLVRFYYRRDRGYFKPCSLFLISEFLYLVFLWRQSILIESQCFGGQFYHYAGWVNTASTMSTSGMNLNAKQGPQVSCIWRETFTYTKLNFHALMHSPIYCSIGNDCCCNIFTIFAVSFQRWTFLQQQIYIFI